MFTDIFIAFSGVIIVRFSRFLRPIFLLLEVRRLKYAARNTAETILELSKFLLLIFVIVLLLAVSGVFLFGERLYGEYASFENFDTLGFSILQVYSAFTEEIFPRLIYPALDIHKYLIVYFLAIFFVTSITYGLLVGNLFESYKTRRAVTAITDRFKERYSLAMAFLLLDESKKGWIDYQVFTNLIQRLSGEKSTKQIDKMWEMINEEDEHRLTMSEFFKLCDILTLEFFEPGKVREREPSTITQRMMRRFFRSQVWKYVFMFVCITNTALFCLAVLERWDRKVFNIWMRLINAWTIFFALQELAKVFAFGFRVYYDHHWNIFNSCIVLLSGVSQILVLLLPVPSAEEGIRIFYCFSSFTILLDLFALPILRNTVEKILVILPTLFDVFVLLSMVFYIFAVIGMEAFAGQVRSQNNNFDSFGGALFVVFIAMVGHDWILVQYEFMYEKPSIALYFVSAVLILNIIFLELVIAILVEMYAVLTEIKEQEERAKFLEKKKSKRVDETHEEEGIPIDRHKTMKLREMEDNGKDEVGAFSPTGGLNKK